MTGGSVYEETKPFRITSLQDADDFARCISRYGEATVPEYYVCDHIRKAYEYSRTHCDDDRINGNPLLRL